MVRDLLARFYGNNQSSQNSNCNTNQNSMNQAGTYQTGGGSSKLSLEPSHALIIAGLLGGVLEVTSVLVDKNQLVEFVLSGLLKKKMIDQIGSKPCDEVIKGGS